MSMAGLRTFSDAFMAIILTVMVLELKVPNGATLGDLLPLFPILLSYVLSFGYLGIYWANHHYLLQVGGRLNGVILWANLHLLFWLSLLPFVTSWMGQNHLARQPTVFYGAVLFLASAAYLLLQRAIIQAQGEGSALKAAVGSDWKGRLSLVLYLTGSGAAFLRPWVGQLLFVAGAGLWIVPDRRLERLTSAGVSDMDAQHVQDSALAQSETR